MELFFSMETLKEKFKYQGTSAHSNFQEGGFVVQSFIAIIASPTTGTV